MTGISKMFQWSYRCISKDGFKEVTMMLYVIQVSSKTYSRKFQNCFKKISRVFQRCLKNVSQMFHWCLKDHSRMFQRRCKCISIVLQICLKKEGSKVFQRFLQEVPRVSQESFDGVWRTFLHYFLGVSGSLYGYFLIISRKFQVRVFH